MRETDLNIEAKATGEHVVMDLKFSDWRGRLKPMDIRRTPGRRMTLQLENGTSVFVDERG